MVSTRRLLGLRQPPEKGRGPAEPEAFPATNILARDYNKSRTPDHYWDNHEGQHDDYEAS